VIRSRSTAKRCADCGGPSAAWQLSSETHRWCFACCSGRVDRQLRPPYVARETWWCPLLRAEWERGGHVA